MDFQEGVLLVRNSWDKRNHLGPVKTAASSRRVPITPALLSQLAARSLDFGELDFVLARAPGENPPSQTNFRTRGWNPAVKLSGLVEGPRVTPHDARHAFTSQLADLNLSSGDLAPILGHTTAGITEAIYTHAFNRDEREARVREAMERALAS